ncbi:hypothetical protein OUZ56_029837 [Daphnia magna]|uniref:Uncharacterized protein n=1 Tax=Daphnia magna TaxID=35525 RepID=A0ABR0B7Y3_9CRUS|nr:hypothetical protein OUZ56_029837 [Daphnia magna]
MRFFAVVDNAQPWMILYTLYTNLVSERRSRRVETVTATSQWDYPGPLIGSLNPCTLPCTWVGGSKIRSEMDSP